MGTKKQPKQGVAVFLASIKWGCSNDDLDEKDLPADFVKAKKLWAQ